MSRTDFAASQGVTRQAIDQAIAAGRLPVAPDGRIDLDAADATWGQRRRARGEGAAAEERRERALLQSTIAKIQMTRRRALQLRDRLVERDRETQAINALLSQLYEAVRTIPAGADPADATLLEEAIAAIIEDLGDLRAEGLKVTRED
jgi:hypothetical protein